MGGKREEITFSLFEEVDCLGSEATERLTLIMTNLFDI